VRGGMFAGKDLMIEKENNTKINNG